MKYKFFIGNSTTVQCDKTEYQEIELKDSTLKCLCLYNKGVEIGNIVLSKDTEIKYNEGFSNESIKVYFVN